MHGDGKYYHMNLIVMQYYIAYPYPRLIWAIITTCACCTQQDIYSICIVGTSKKFGDSCVMRKEHNLRIRNMIRTMPNMRQTCKPEKIRCCWVLQHVPHMQGLCTLASWTRHRCHLNRLNSTLYPVCISGWFILMSFNKCISSTKDCKAKSRDKHLHTPHPLPWNLTSSTPKSLSIYKSLEAHIFRQYVCLDQAD